METLLNIIHKYDVDPDEIELEITESILIDDFSAVTEKMQLLKEYGIRISLDDFGTGFSSLSYLKKLPININICGPSGVISFRDICLESRCHRKRSNNCCRRCTDLLGQKERGCHADWKGTGNSFFGKSL